jgi:hypothetical protein
MKWKKVTPEKYKLKFAQNQSVFHSPDFNELNSLRAEELAYLIYESDYFTLGCIFGKKNNTWYSPFSSPFGGIEIVGELIEREVEQAISKLTLQFQADIQITLPPEEYTNESNSIRTKTYLNANFNTAYIDQNFHLDISLSDFNTGLKRNARKNLNKAFSIKHQFLQVKGTENERKAYELIAQNRREKGYPLKMTFEQIQLTGKIVPYNFFILEMEDVPCAAALVYKICHSAAMVVYWGHLEKFSEMRPVNLLAHYLFEEYKSQGFKILDIGPSSENGVLNEGLANFKLSLGCIMTEKPTLRYEFN